MRPIAFAAAAAALLASAPAVSAPVSGARVEAVIGLDSARLDGFGNRSDVGDSAVLYGLGIGYDVPIGTGAAIGIDLEATDSGAEFRQADALTDIRLELGRDLYAGARLTASVAPSVALYFKAGYTNVATRGDFRTTTFSEVIEANEGGIRAGGGAQISLGGNAFVGAEYRFSSYDGDLRRHQGVAALGLRF